MECLIQSSSDFIHKFTLELGLWVSKPLTRKMSENQLH